MIMTPEEQLNGKRIEDVFDKEFFDSNFWTFWASMFAFEKWHSAIEMRRYLTRFIHHTRNLTDLSCLKFTTYNQVQKPNEIIAWVYGLFSGTPGDFVKKPMRECTGAEICEEWLYHLGVPTDRIVDLAENHARTIPCMMPYVTSYFMVRDVTDRPKVVPDGAVNFAFVGEYVETPRDTVFTTEYAVRTGMEAVYTLLNLDRGVPEVFASCYDVRCLLDATAGLMDGRKITDMKLSFIEKVALDALLKRMKGTRVEEMLKEYGLI